MKIKTSLLIAFISILFQATSQEKWPKESEIEFNLTCVDAYNESFYSAIGELIAEVNLEKLDKLSKRQCACMYEVLKKTYDSADEAFAQEVEILLSQASECEPTDAEIDDLMQK